MNESILQTHNGLIRFYDGTIIAIEIREYSADGIYHWETIFNPFDHISTLDAITQVKGHKYTRVKHTGDVNYQLPYRIIPKEPIFRVENGIFEWKYLEESNEEWKLLLDTEILKGKDGDKGDKGEKGDGLYIDAAGFYLLKPDCCSTLTSTTSSCTSCNRGDDNTNLTKPYLFLSIGDGAKEIVLNDVGLYRSCTAETGSWIEITSNDIGRLTRFTALDNIGTGYIDYRLQDTLSTRGKVYICADGRWIQFINMNVPTYLVGEALGSSNIGYLDNFVLPLQLALTGTITLNNGKLEVIANSIDETAFKQTTFGDGIIIENLSDKPKVFVDDFAGFGLLPYESLTDGKRDIQVDVLQLIGDGLTNELGTTVDGETRNIAIVNTDNLISINSGLESRLPIAGESSDLLHKDLFVKAADAILVDSDGVNVKSDELSLTSLDSPIIKIKPYTAGNDGVMAIHLNPNVVNKNRALKLDNNTGIGIILDTISPYDNLEFSTPDSNGYSKLRVKENGIHGIQLNDDVATVPLKVSSNLLNLLYDDAKLELNGSSELTIKDSYIEGLIPNNLVTSLYKADNPTNKLNGDIALNVTNSRIEKSNSLINILSFNTLSFTAEVETGDDEIQFNLEFNEGLFVTGVETIIDDNYIHNKLLPILLVGDGINLTSDSSLNTITISADLDLLNIIPANTVANLTDNTGTVGISLDYARADHEHPVTDICNFKGKTSSSDEQNILLKTMLDNRMKLDTWYKNIRVSSTEGLQIKSTSEKIFTIMVDDFGQLDTIPA